VAIAFALAPPLVDQTSQSLEDAWKPVYLIENDQSFCVLGEVEFGIAQLRPVGGKLQIEVECVLSKFVRQGMCERGLAHLPRAEQRHCGKLLEELAQLGLSQTRNHTL